MTCSPVGYYQLGRVYPRDLLRQRYRRGGAFVPLASLVPVPVPTPHDGDVFVGPDPGRQLLARDPGRDYAGPDLGRAWRPRQ